jgi:chromosome segregation ATPase
VENTAAFKSVTFGGFNKQDVISYIEKVSSEHTAALEGVRRENETLKQETASLSEKLALLTQQLQEQTDANAAAQEALEKAEQELSGLREIKPEYERLKSESEALRADAQAYQGFKARIGGIECEARHRAAELEAETNARLRALAADFREKYETLSATFNTANGYINGELRKVEVNLSQLPRSLDKTGADLNALEALLNEKKD